MEIETATDTTQVQLVQETKAEPSELCKEVAETLTQLHTTSFPALKKYRRKLESSLQEDGLDDETRKALEDTHSSLNSAIEKLSEQVEKTYRELDDNLNKLTESIEAGQLKLSLSLYEKCNARVRKLKSLEVRSKKFDSYQRQLREKRPALKELKDWRSWGMDHARDEIIARLMRLCETEYDPRDLAVQVRQIREQWNKLNHSGDYPSRSSRRRFDNACEKAFEPCKKYFDEQKSIRAENVKRRQNIVNRLEETYDATDWKRPDWKRISQILDGAKKEWKKAVPLTKQNWNRTNEQFDQIYEKYKPHLQREIERGIAFRRELIKQAEALDKQSPKEGIEAVIRLQKQWNTVAVRGTRKQENELWKKFRGTCDQQFERGKKERRKYKERRQSAILERKELLDEMKSFQQQIPSDLPEAKHQTAKFKKKRNSFIESTHNPQAQKLDESIKGVFTRINKALSAAEQAQQSKILGSLKLMSDLCARVEASVDNENALQCLAQAKIDWQKLESGCGQYETDIQKRFKAACKLIESGKVSKARKQEMQKNLDLKLDTCLRLEIVAEIDSPAEYARDRMQLQVQRLNAAITTHNPNNVNPNLDSQKLVVQFCTTGAVEPQYNHELQNRFDRIFSELY